MWIYSWSNTTAQKQSACCPPANSPELTLLCQSHRTYLVHHFTAGKAGSSRVGDGGASWRLKALARAKNQATDASDPNYGRRVGDIVSEQWGSLAQLTAGLTGTRAAHGKVTKFTTVLTKNKTSPKEKCPLFCILVYIHVHTYIYIAKSDIVVFFNTYTFVHILYTCTYIYIYLYIYLHRICSGLDPTHSLKEVQSALYRVS